MTEDVKPASPSPEAVAEKPEGDETPKEPKEEVSEETPPEAPKSGNKTDPNLLLKSLQEERDKRRELEQRETELKQEVEELKSSLSPEEEDPKLKALGDQITELQDARELDEVIAQNPALKEYRQDLIEFKKSEHPRAKITSAAKIFLVEKDLLEQPRKGLEKPTGGDKTPQQQGMTAEDVDNLRKTDYRKYVELVKSGKLEVS